MSKLLRDIHKDYIKKSKDRCRSYGLSVNLKYSKRILKGIELQKKLDINKELIIIAEPFINHLYNFVKGSNFFVVLTDAEGMILRVIGDEDILSEALSLKMIPGAYMDEYNIGTNAMSLALNEKVPIQISGEDHYIDAYHKWTCSAAPIKDANSNIIGILDLTGYGSFVHSHTLGMVVAAAHAIESMLEIKKYNYDLEISKRYVDTIIDNIPAGILTADLNGNIKLLNEYTPTMFGYSYEEMKSMNLRDIFEGWDKVKTTVISRLTFLDEDVYVSSKNNKLQLNLSVYPVLDTMGKVLDLICVFKEVKKVRKLANKIMGRHAIYTFDKIIGRNHKFLEILEFAKKISDSRSTVLITGESGTGKEIFAQSIHNHSKGRDEPFVAINCGAIPKNLIESELFGYEEGAFTGAKRGGQVGKFEVADGGTLFLDEIGEMPIDMQTKLLRTIEEGTVSRIGSTKEIVVDVRIIAATNKDLFEEVKKGNFRKDLFYRLNVLPIKLPALRERPEDIPLLIDYYMERISKKLNKKMVFITEEQMHYFINYPWPGNIRELENLIELIINTEAIPSELRSDKIFIEYDMINSGERNLLSLEDVEKNHIIKTLEAHDGNISSSAKVLGVGRNTLYRKIEKYMIDCSKFEQSSKVEQ